MGLCAAAWRHRAILPLIVPEAACYLGSCLNLSSSSCRTLCWATLPSTSALVEAVVPRGVPLSHPPKPVAMMSNLVIRVWVPAGRVMAVAGAVARIGVRVGVGVGAAVMTMMALMM